LSPIDIETVERLSRRFVLAAPTFVVGADSPYRTAADLNGKPIAWGAQGSGR